MAIKIELDDAVFAQLEDAAQQAAVATMEALRGEVVTAQVMPFDTGEMQDNRTFVKPLKMGARLETDAPQARRLYFHPEYNFQTINNPNAQGEWLRHWLEGGEYEDFVPQTFEKLLKGGGA